MKKISRKLMEANMQGMENKLRRILKELENIEGLSDIHIMRKRCRDILNDRTYWEHL